MGTIALIVALTHDADIASETVVMIVERKGFIVECSTGISTYDYDYDYEFVVVVAVRSQKRPGTRYGEYKAIFG